MRNLKKSLTFIVIFTLLTCTGTRLCHANSAEPPSILIIVPNAPDSLEISIGDNQKSNRTDKAFESYFTFYSFQLKSADYTIKIKTANISYEMVLDVPLKTYNNIFTLDLEKRTLTPGKSFTRDITFLSARILLTLALEALLFFLLGYRQRKSWMIFLIVNLVTQGALYLWLNASLTPLPGSYFIFSLIFGEILIVITEMIAFLVLVNEFHRLRTAFYVIAGNLLSLIAGGYLLTILPV